MGLKQRENYRGRATDSGKRGEPKCIPAVARPQAQPQMNRAPEAPTLQQAFEAAKRGERCLQRNPSTLTSSAATTAYTAQTSARPILAKDTDRINPARVSGPRDRPGRAASATSPDRVSHFIIMGREHISPWRRTRRRHDAFRRRRKGPWSRSRKLADCIIATNDGQPDGHGRRSTRCCVRRRV